MINTMRIAAPSGMPWKLTPSLLALCLMLGACAGANQAPPPRPPLELLAPMAIPDREQIKTVGHMAQIILEDEKVMRMKNADLAAARELLQRE